MRGAGILAMGAVGLLAAATHGPMSAGIAALGLVVIPLLFGARRQVSSAVGPLMGPVLGLVFAGGGFLLGASGREAVAGALVGLMAGSVLQVGRDGRPLVMAVTLQVALAAAVGMEVHVGALIGAWSLAAPLALLPPSTRSEASGLALPMLAVIGLALTGFVFAPRWTGADLGGVSTIGLGEDVVLGATTSLVGDDEVVLRVRGEGLDAGSLYLRGRVYQDFDGSAWRLAGSEPRGGSASRGERSLDVVQEGLGANMPLFTTGDVARIDVDGRAVSTASGAWYLDGPARRVAYRIWFDDRAESTPGGDSQEWTALPDLPDALREATAAIAPSASEPWDLAVAVRAHLVARHPYTLAPPQARVDALTEFLVEQQPGHCGYFASAAVVILRGRGVPARLVTGFAGGEWHGALGEVVFRQQHAHAWVEVWHDGGWRPIDVTPGPVRSAPGLASTAGLAEWVTAGWLAVLSWDLERQRETLRGLGDRLGGAGELSGLLVVIALLLGVGVLGIIGIRWLVGRSAGGERHAPEVGRSLDRYRRRLERAGWSIPTHLPPVAAAEWVDAQSDGGAESFLALSWLYYRCEYGGSPEREVSQEARRLADAPLPVRVEKVPERRGDRSR